MSLSHSQVRFNATNMTSRIQTALKGLVSKGTITEAQSDKIEPILTNAFSTHSTSSEQSHQSQGKKNSTTTSSSSGTRRSGLGRTNILSPLVINKTITQSQANAVMQSIMPQRSAGQSVHGNQNNSKKA
jgi:hypothetical protein